VPSAILIYLILFHAYSDVAYWIIYLIRRWGKLLLVSVLVIDFYQHNIYY